jgi:hypothetical protein
MDPLDVTVISCLYGQTHDRFLYEWISAVDHLDPAPARIILTASRDRFVPPAHVYCYRNSWTYPQAFFLNKAAEQVDTEWFWIVDIDDLAMPDALEGIDDHDADVVQVGFLRSDGEIHLPSREGPTNQYVAGSIIRTDAFRAVGGFRDVEHQDSDLWERLLDAGAAFTPADRPRFHYRRHPNTRTAREAA